MRLFALNQMMNVKGKKNCNKVYILRLIERLPIHPPLDSFIILRLQNFLVILKVLNQFEIFTFDKKNVKGGKHKR